MGQSVCDGCPLRGSCAYSTLFENYPHPFRKNRYDHSAPKPYIISVWHTGEASDDLEVNVILVGEANRYYPYVQEAMKRVGEKGIGKARQPLRLNRVIQELPNGLSDTLYAHTHVDQEGNFSGWGPVQRIEAFKPETLEIPPLPPFIRLTLHTPVRLKSITQEAHHNIRLNQLLISIVRRTADLAQYWHQPLEAIGERIREAKNVTALDQKHDWQSQSRFSSRQRKTIFMGGALGHFDLELSQYPLLWPWLWAGQWLHVGKGAAMGSGRYSLTGAADYRALLEPVSEVG
ncbi:MAG: CRISPR system precrRNA processing endoribonuclease RAMP protein Cas6 [Gammaproteobacteria bacterium]